MLVPGESYDHDADHDNHPDRHRRDHGPVGVRLEHARCARACARGRYVLRYEVCELASKPHTKLEAKATRKVAFVVPEAARDQRKR